jgi:hypothetical protein
MVRPTEQAASSPSVLGIVLEDSPVPDRRQDIVERDRFLDHLLVGVLGNPEVFPMCLVADTRQCCFLAQGIGRRSSLAEQTE